MKYLIDETITLGNKTHTIRVPRGLSFFNSSCGAGKTYYFKILRSYLYAKSIPYYLFNYEHTDTPDDMRVKLCEGSKIVMLDNIDLYGSKSLLDRIKAIPSVEAIIISGQLYAGLGRPDTYLHVERTNKGLIIT